MKKILIALLLTAFVTAANLTITETPQKIQPPCKIGFSSIDTIVYVVGDEVPTADTRWETMQPFTAVTTVIWVRTAKGKTVVVDKRDI